MLEVVIAAGLLAVFLSGVFAMNSRGLQQIKSNKETAIVLHSMQQRMEQIRGANWSQVTDAQQIKDAILTTPTAASDDVAQFAEDITVSAYPNGAVVPPLRVSRLANGTVTVVSASPDMINQASVLVYLRSTWNGTPRGKLRALEAKTIVGSDGVLK